MSIDAELVKKVAGLARIALPEERIGPMADELNGILRWVEQLQAVDTDEVAPMSSAVAHKLAWRVDEVTDGNCRDDVLSNAPHAELGFFAVPKVIE